ncbi:hypothetical protein GCM10028856_26720 [Halopiger thermotolerans]
MLGMRCIRRAATAERATFGSSGAVDEPTMPPTYDVCGVEYGESGFESPRENRDTVSQYDIGVSVTFRPA